MTSTADDSILSQLEESRRQFLALVNDVRPDLHRYCARMTGSIADGEDVVQDTLARAYYELPELKELPAMPPGCFGLPTIAPSTISVATSGGWESRLKLPRKSRPMIWPSPILRCCARKRCAGPYRCSSNSSRRSEA